VTPIGRRRSQAGRLATAILGMGLIGLVAGGCSGSAEPHAAAYTFHQDDSPVKVDTPELRALKAAAHIEPCPASDPVRSRVAGGLPDMTLPCLGGGRGVDLAGLRGPLVLNFWAQYCGPCRTESPLLQRLSTSAEGRVRVVGVDFYDPRPSNAIAFAKDLGLTYPQIADPAAATKGPLHISGLPVTLFVDGSGRVAYTQVGAISSESQLAMLVHDHLGVTVPAGAGS